VAANLRRFASGDRDAVAALSRHALARLEEQVGKPLWANRADLDGELATWDSDPADSLLVMEEDGEAAGFGGIQPGGDVTVLGPLVAPRFRGQKMGTTLLEASIELARKGDAAWLLASVGPRNVAGRMILERHGFRPQEGVDAVYRLLPADHRPAGPAPPGVVVREGRPDDLDRVWVLYRLAFPLGRRTEDVWRRWLDAGEVVVAEREGAVVAFLHIEPGPRWITHVGVAEEAQGLGVGGYLFSQAVEDWWRRQPESELRLSVKPYNTPAIRVYRRLGFAPWLVLQSFELEL
jgi:ribosomal protein S18 acetylase RimI-like enzyme